MYRCEAVSIAGFIQQLAVAYVANGYFFYVTGCIPSKKDPLAVDSKLIDRYGIDCSKWARWRRKERGLGSVQYLRFRRFFVLLATPGEHEFFTHEAPIQDIRRKPIQCFGYSIGCYRGRKGGWHPSVRIERTLFYEVKKQLMDSAIKETPESLRTWFEHLRFEAYAPIRRQMITLLSSVNRVRMVAGVEALPFAFLRLKRRPLSPFGQNCSGCLAESLPRL